MPYTIREAQPTPNPNALKLVLDRPIAEQPLSFLTPAAGVGHPLAEQLFAVPGVVGLLLLHDFITVNKAPTAKWSAIRPKVERILNLA
jgi:hypothetical protein